MFFFFCILPGKNDGNTDKKKDKIRLRVRMKPYSFFLHMGVLEIGSARDLVLQKSKECPGSQPFLDGVELPANVGPAAHALSSFRLSK